MLILLIIKCLWFHSGDCGSCTDNRTVHRTHRSLLFLAARHHRARGHWVCHVLGQSDHLDDHQERGVDRCRLFSFGLWHIQQRLPNHFHVRSCRSPGNQHDSFGRPMTGNPATSSTTQPANSSLPPQNSRLPVMPSTSLR